MKKRKKKKCCKTCKRLEFYDWYLCIHSKEEGLIIEDIENYKCKYYKNSKVPFWN